MLSDSVTIYSPYEKIYNYWGEENVVDIPSQIRDYLLLLPCKECPNPIETNDNPRARFLKYLFYDDANPLDKPIPTVQERLSIVFDPYNPDKPPISDKGYRIFCQSNVGQANIIGQTILRIIMGQTASTNPYSVTFSVNFQILSNYSIEANTRSTALLRTFNMEQSIVQALNGVNMGGVGTFMFARSGLSSENRGTIATGSKPISDDQELVGRLLVMTFENKVTSDEYVLNKNKF